MNDTPAAGRTFRLVFSLTLLCTCCFANIHISDPLFIPTARYDYCIITPSRPAMLDELESFAQWKSEKGLKTRIATLDSIGSSVEGKDIQQKIRTFIRTAHDHWGVQWILLVGDHDLLPSRTLSSGNQYFPFDTSTITSDLYYACLEGEWDSDQDGRFGNEQSTTKYALSCRYEEDGSYTCDKVVPRIEGLDLWNDVYIGRLPASNAEELRIMLRKIREYRSTPRPEKHGDDILFLGAQLHTVRKIPESEYPMDDVSYYWHHQVKPVIERNTSSLGAVDIDEVYEDTVLEDGTVKNDTIEITHEKMNTFLSRGYNMVFFSFHGQPAAVRIWSLADSIPKQPYTYLEAAQVRSPFYSNFISISCSVMEMMEDTNTCFAKSLLTNPAGGAVSYTGAAAIDYFDMRCQHYLKAIELMCEYKVKRIARAFELANVMKQSRYSLIVIQHWGDPEMQMFTRSVHSGDSFAIDISRMGDTYRVCVLPALDSVLVCLSGNNNIYRRGYTRNGVVLFDAIPDNEGVVTLTATHQNRLRSSVDIELNDVVPVMAAPSVNASDALCARVSTTRGAVSIHFLQRRPSQAALFDMAGKRVAQMQPKTAARLWRIDGLAPGGYVLRARSGGHTLTRRLAIR
jgi:hypothetical protein